MPCVFERKLGSFLAALERQLALCDIANVTFPELSSVTYCLNVGESKISTQSTFPRCSLKM